MKVYLDLQLIEAPEGSDLIKSLAEAEIQYKIVSHTMPNLILLKRLDPITSEV